MKTLSILRGALAGCSLVLMLAPGCTEDQTTQRPGSQPTTARTPAKDAVRFAASTADGRECLIPSGIECFIPPSEMGGNPGEILIAPGTMLEARRSESGPVPHPATQPNTVGFFLYIYRGDEKQPLEFVGEECVGTLNGKPVFLDLSAPGAGNWLRAQTAAGLKSIRSLALGDDRKLDLDALRKLAGQDILLDVKTDADFAKDKEFVDAIVSAKPAGLVAMTRPNAGLMDLVPRLTHLTHLGISPCDPAKLRGLHDLRFLLLDVKESTGTTTRPSSKDEFKPPSEEYVAPDPARVAALLSDVSQLTQLRSLRLVSCKGVSDFKPLGKLTGLRNLSLDGCERLGSLKPIAPLSHLQALAIVGANGLESLSGIEKFGDLEKLTIIPLPKGDLKPLKQLKKLRILCVSADDRKSRKAELDDIQKALPDLEIVGFCMGSAWIMLILPAGALAGLAWRRCRGDGVCRHAADQKAGR